MIRCTRAVLRLIQFATEAALRMRMPVSVCGEMAGNPRLTPLLLGLGLRSFLDECQRRATRQNRPCARSASTIAPASQGRVMEQSDPERIQELVMKFGT
ncbi:MAG: putative PEP-binding protein [Rhodospirillales bacterium]